MRGTISNRVKLNRFIPSWPSLKPAFSLISCAILAIVSTGFDAAFADTAAVNLDIPAGNLVDSLAIFSRQTGIKVSLDASQLQGKASDSLKGTYSAQTGLERLLNGTGYHAKLTDSGYLITKAASSVGHLQTVKVTANSDAPLQTTVHNGALGNGKVLDTPLSLTVVNQEEIQDRQVNSIQSLFYRDASVVALGNTYSNFGDSISVRGLMLDYTTSFKVNGLAASSFSGQMPLEVFEKVELLKGVSGFMYGFGAPGGIVNYNTKKPTDEDVRTLDIGYRESGILSEHADLGGRVNDGMFGYRVNLVNEKGDLFQNDGEIDRQTGSVSLDAKLTDTVIVGAEYINDQRRIDNPSVPYLNNYLDADSALPSVIDSSRNLGLRGAFEDHSNAITNLNVAWQFATGWNVRVDYSNAKNETRWTKTLVNLNNTTGDFDAYAYDQATDFNFETVQSLLQGTFNALGVKHELVIGAVSESYVWYRSDATSSYTEIGSSNIFSPTELSFHSQLKRDMSKSTTIDQDAAFISDRISFSEQWSALFGVRHTQYTQADKWSDWASYDKSVNTPTVALFFKPEADTSIYVSYVEALQQGSTVPDDGTYANGGELLKPLKSKQYEWGVKTDQSNWSATAALFRIERAAEYKNQSNYLVQDGLRIYQGLELSGHLQATTAWDISGGAMWLDATYDKTEPDSGLKDNRVEATPRFQTTLETGYRFPQLTGLRIALGLKHLGNSMEDSDNHWNLPAVTLLDLNASYVTSLGNHDLTLRGSVTNLTDKKYWATEGYGGLRAGEAQIASFNVQLAF